MSINELLFMGDISLSDLDLDTLKSDASSLSFYFEKKFPESHLIANIESPLCKNLSNINKSKFPRVPSLDSNVRFLKKFNLDTAIIGNNHVFDCLEEGVKSTIDALYASDINAVGVNYDQVNSSLKVNNLIFDCYVSKQTNPSIPFDSKVNLFFLEDLDTSLLPVKDSKSTRIASIHWGVEFSLLPTPSQIRLARELSNSYDIIYGHHPHVLQPHEIYNNSFIIYSAGNFYFNDVSLEGNKKLQWKGINKTTALYFVKLKNNSPYHISCIYINNSPSNVLAKINPVYKLLYLFMLKIVKYQVLYFPVYLIYSIYSGFIKHVFNKIFFIILNPRVLSFSFVIKLTSTAFRHISSIIKQILSSDKYG